MAKQDSKREKKSQGEKKDDEAAYNPEVVKKGEKLKEEIDHLMDEIDDVLEENAEEFVKNYVQKGGE